MFITAQNETRSVPNSEWPSQVDKVQERTRAEACVSVWKHGEKQKTSSAHGRCLSQLDQSENRLSISVLGLPTSQFLVRELSKK